MDHLSDKRAKEATLMLSLSSKSWHGDSDTYVVSNSSLLQVPGLSEFIPLSWQRSLSLLDSGILNNFHLCMVREVCSIHHD